MSRLQTNTYFFFGKIICFCILIFFTGCGFVDLREIGLATIPSEPYTILDSDDSHVILRFNTAMLEKETESVIQITSPSGSVEGDLRWKGNELHFIPASSWMKGIRYVLKISGTVYSKDGRDFYFSRELPFFALSDYPLPYLVSSDPPDGASTIAFSPEETMLRLEFSLPMNRQSTLAALNCDSFDPAKTEWSDDDRVLSVKPLNPLSAWTAYRWSVSDKALGREGTPLAKTVSGRFITDKDNVFPEIIGVIPLIPAENDSYLWGSWMPVDVSLENGLGRGQSIGVKFNKPMDVEKLRNALSFDPALPGRTAVVASDRVVYVPDRNPDPETFYTLKISGEVKDTRGLKMGSDYSVIFKSDIPFLRVYSLILEDKPTEIFEPEKNTIFPVMVEEADDGVIRFVLRFSTPLSVEAKIDAVSRISLTPFFPGHLGTMSIRSVRWIGSDRVRMEWNGAECGKDNEPHFYKLSLPGGRTGISNGEGSYLREEIYYYFEAVKK